MPTSKPESIYTLTRQLDKDLRYMYGVEYNIDLITNLDKKSIQLNITTNRKTKNNKSLTDQIRPFILQLNKNDIVHSITTTLSNEIQKYNKIASKFTEEKACQVLGYTYQVDWHDCK